jgi:hypothetical protein
VNTGGNRPSLISESRFGRCKRDASRPHRQGGRVLERAVPVAVELDVSASHDSGVFALFNFFKIIV